MSRPYMTPAESRRKITFFVALIFAAMVVIAGLWLGIWWERGPRNSGFGSSAGKKVASGNHPPYDYPSSQPLAGLGRQPLLFRAKAVESEAVIGILAAGSQMVDERVGQLRGMRGMVLSAEERATAVEFLAGRNVPAGMGKGSMHWLADELMTVLRLQEPPQEGLAADLAKVAFQPGTDPVVRDYIMQHLGHLWEQYGVREEIEKSLWTAVASSDETTPGTALIALSRGYQRDQQLESLTTVQQRAFTLAANSNSPLAVRVTALSIAGEGGGTDVQALANRLLEDPTTPLILRKVAERVGK